MHTTMTTLAVTVLAACLVLTIAAESRSAAEARAIEARMAAAAITHHLPLLSRPGDR